MNSSIELQMYIGKQIRLGTLDIDLMKPLNFITQMFYRNMSIFLVILFTRGLPGILFAIFVLGIELPKNFKTILAFLISVFLGYLVYFDINLLVGLIAIITLDIRSYTLEKMLEEVTSETVNSRDDLIDTFKKVLKERIIRLIDDHNTPSFIILFYLETQTLVVKAEYGSPPVNTNDEIMWYRKYGKNLSFVPKCFAFLTTGHIAAFVMEYIEDATTLDEFVFQNPLAFDKAYSSIVRTLEMINFFSKGLRKRYNIN